MLPEFGEEPSAEKILEFLGTPGVGVSPGNLLHRYRDITGPDHHRLAIMPGQVEMLRKIVLPLRAAIGSYMLGNYLGTIAICGAVCEMLAIVSFEMEMTRRGTKALDEVTQKKIFGGSFERLGQERRIHVLKGMGVIDTRIESVLGEPRRIRNEYLHKLSKPHDTIANDAKKAWSATHEAFLAIIKLRPAEGGKLEIDAVLARYLQSTAAM